MAKKRVHEIAKAQGLTSKELLAALNAAGIEAKAAQSSVEESDALAALKGSGDGASSGSSATATKAKQVRAWRIGGPNNEVKRLVPGLSRTAAPAKVTGLKQGLWLRWTKGSG